MLPKVFGTGFQKTGTTTLGVMLEQLGYRTAGYFQFRHLAGQHGLTLDTVETLALQLAADYDATKDTPWPLFYKSLDRAYPGSKFIHVTRDPQSWVRSVVKDFGDRPNALHQAIYGVPCPKGHEDIWLARYNQHNAQVHAYFADRPDDCLFLRLEDGITYPQLCRFLDRPLVTKTAPKANTALKKRLKLIWWRFFRQP